MSAFDSLTDLQKKIFKETAEEFGSDYRIQFHDVYSGRVMYGATTYGVSGDFQDLLVFMQLLGCKLTEQSEELIFAFRSDQLGKGMILYIR